MTCTSPRQAFLPIDVTYGSGLIFSQHDKNAGEPITISCRTCMSCKILRAQGRAFLLWAESLYNPMSCCVTLTYDAEHLPPHGFLSKGPDSDSTKFIRALRDYYKYRGVDLAIKYFNAGEYGGEFGRPHHHIIIYGYDFPDKVFSFKKGANDYFVSELLDSLWGKGRATIGDVSVATSNYVSKYVLAKDFGADADRDRRDNGIVCEDTGEVLIKTPEYCTMSRGIGRDYFFDNVATIYPADFVMMSGSDFQFRVPEYFDNMLKVANSDLYDKIKSVRKSRVELNTRKFTEQDLKAIDVNVRARIALYNKRSME